MNVLIVSECEKRALVETRRIVDQFAERHGDRTWQTPITKEGLDTLHTLLRKTARKNTAVACHWVRGLNHSELLWVVGDKRRFNAHGAVPTNTTQRNVLRQQDENDWHSGELVGLLSDLSGLLHDLGKATRVFQQRLKAPSFEKNFIRHEWVSLRMFEAFVGDDEDAAWLKRLAEPTPADDARWIQQLRKDKPEDKVSSPFKRMRSAPLAQAIGWLVVSHHRLPNPPPETNLSAERSFEDVLTLMQPAWNEPNFDVIPEREVEGQWQFANTLPTECELWRHRTSRMAKRLLQMLGSAEGMLSNSPLGNPFVMHLSRLCLMLADHHYSSLQSPSHPERRPVLNKLKQLHHKPTVWANTTGAGKPNQSLDEHLLGVAQHAAEIARFLPGFQSHLPHLGKSSQIEATNHAAGLSMAEQGS